MNLAFRECQGLERKVNPESQGLEESLEKTGKRERGGVRASLVTQGTLGSRAGWAPREIKAKLVLLVPRELS